MSTPAASSSENEWRLWFALVGGAVAWAGHLLSAYAVAEFGCVAGLGHRDVFSLTIVSWMLLVVSAVMTAIAAAALLVSCRINGESPSSAPAPSLDADERAAREFVGRFGRIANGLFLFTVLVQSIPIFFYWGRC
jgi:hypothetical protein